MNIIKRLQKKACAWWGHDYDTCTINEKIRLGWTECKRCGERKERTPIPVNTKTKIITDTFPKTKETSDYNLTNPTLLMKFERVKKLQWRAELEFFNSKDNVVTYKRVTNYSIVKNIWGLDLILAKTRRGYRVIEGITATGFGSNWPRASQALEEANKLLVECGERGLIKLIIDGHKEYGVLSPSYRVRGEKEK